MLLKALSVVDEWDGVWEVCDRYYYYDIIKNKCIMGGVVVRVW